MKVKYNDITGSVYKMTKFFSAYVRVIKPGKLNLMMYVYDQNRWLIKEYEFVQFQNQIKVISDEL